MERTYECPICKKKYTTLKQMFDCATKCEAKEQEAEKQKLRQEAQAKLIEQTYADVKRVYKELCSKVNAYNKLVEGTNKTELICKLTSADYEQQCQCGARTSTIKDKCENQKNSAKQEQDGIKVINLDKKNLDELLKDEEFNSLVNDLADAFSGLFI